MVNRVCKCWVNKFVRVIYLKYSWKFARLEDAASAPSPLYLQSTYILHEGALFAMKICQKKQQRFIIFCYILFSKLCACLTSLCYCYEFWHATAQLYNVFLSNQNTLFSVCFNVVRSWQS